MIFALLAAAEVSIPWEAIAAIVAVLVAGFGAWMFRIDRGIVEIKHLYKRVDDLEDGAKVQNDKIEKHGTRITRVEMVCKLKPEA